MHLTSDQLAVLAACGYDAAPVSPEQAWQLSQQRRVFHSNGAAVCVRRPDGFLETAATLQHMLQEHAAAMELAVRAVPAAGAEAVLPIPRKVEELSAPDPTGGPSRSPEGTPDADLPAGVAAQATIPPPSAEPNTATRATPAVPIEASVTPDYLVCLEDGRQLKMLKRYLRTAFNMTPEQYRARWGLPPDYPMVAPSAAERRAVISRRPRPGAKSRAGSNGMLILQPAT